MEKIRGLKLKRFSLQNLDKVADLIFFDGPLLSYFEDERENGYLYYWCDVGQECNRWLIFRIAPEHLKLYLSKQIPLHDLVVDPIDGFLYLVDIDSELQFKNTYLVKPERLPHSYIPDPNSYYEFDPIPEDGQEKKLQRYLTRPHKLRSRPKITSAFQPRRRWPKHEVISGQALTQAQFEEQLEPESLNWALSHVLSFGDTDIFPVPFEFSALKYNWNEIQHELLGLDISAYKPNSPRRFPVPKPETGYRVATQLDPIDTLIYTALVYETANLVESYRIPEEQRVACSYRIKTKPNGQLFPSENGWDDFQSKTLEILDKSSKYEYVVVADIADFYNQINHETLEVILRKAGVSIDRTKTIKSFLNKNVNGSSKGIPIGPYASIVLA